MSNSYSDLGVQCGIQEIRYFPARAGVTKCYNDFVAPALLRDNLDAVTAAAVLVFSDKYAKNMFAAPHLENPLWNIKTLRSSGCPLRKTGGRRTELSKIILRITVSMHLLVGLD